jgi:multiple RNA-binding domain-containing protein 1
MLTQMQISDQSLPKSRRLQKEEAAGPRHTDYVPPPKDNNLKRKRADEEAEKDPKLKEFLEVMQAPSKTKSWANDTPIGERAVHDPAVVEQVEVPEDESDNEYQMIEKKVKTSHTAAPPAVAPVVPLTRSNEAPMDEASHAPLAQPVQDTKNAPVATEIPVSDADWLRSRTNRVLDLVEDVDQPPQPASGALPQDAEVPKEEKTEPEQMDIDQPEHLTSKSDEVAAAPTTESEKVRQTGRLYLRNLHFDVTSDDIQEHFAKYGPIEEVRNHLLLLFSILL